MTGIDLFIWALVAGYLLARRRRFHLQLQRRYRR